MESNAGLIHFANVVDEANGEAFEIYEFPKVGGKRGRVIIEREIADDKRQVRSRLRKYNAALLNNPEVEDEVEKVIKEKPRHLLRFAAHYGWTRDNVAFVMPTKTIDPESRRLRVLPPRQTGDDPRPSEAPRGDLASWKREVARLCGYSDIGMMLISAAAAAPLLKMTDRHSFGLNIWGRSKTGKSTMALAGSSFGGVGREGEMPNWAATAAAVGEIARHHCDRLLPINEVGLISKKLAYARIQPAIYQIAEGRERDRHSKSVFATKGEQAHHRTIFASTAEHSISAYARLADQVQDEGEIARCLDVPAVHRGNKTVIDRWPSAVPPERQAAWARRALKRVRRACREHHGVAVEALVEYIVEDMERARSNAAWYMEQFMKRIDTAGMSGAIEHAAENASLIFAGGCMARHAGIVDWPKADIFRAVLRCFRRAVESLANQSDPLERARRSLAARLNGDGIYPVGRGDAAFKASRFDGFVVRQKGRRKFTIRAAAFRDWFKSAPGAHRGILKWLEKIGCLEPRSIREHSGDRPIDWAEKIVEWPTRPRATPTRSIVFFDPFAD